MWYKQAKPYVDAGKLKILGVIQEQHADRALLYKQWKQFDFPIVQDATTQLNLAAVPIPVLIDEHGIVRNSRPRPTDLKQFVNQKFENDDNNNTSNFRDRSQVADHIDKGNIAINSRDDTQLSTAIAEFKNALEANPNNAEAMFSLGTAYRTRFDSQQREKDDFSNASKYWSRALASNPNQYIWRRRIQQYGPRQIKPYPFYDWVPKAIAEIKERGEKPVEIAAALTGSELAAPNRNFLELKSPKNPDPDSKIFIDDEGRIEITSTTVPAVVEKGKTIRVHLIFKINKGKWNDEAEPLRIWINESSGGKPEIRLVHHIRHSQLSSQNEKHIDFEFETTPNSSDCKITGFALYHTCDEDGVCYYHRQDFEIPVTTR